MFEPDLYRDACSESMKLSEETLEEMITMTEQKKHGWRKPLRIGLTAAGLAAALCVTAAAANPEGIKELWNTISVSVTMVHEDDDAIVMETLMPTIEVEEINGRVLLTIDGEPLDITDALQQNGKYVHTWTKEDVSGTLTVNADQTWTAEFTLSGGEMVTYGTGEENTFMYASVENDGVVTEEPFRYFEFTDDDTMTDVTYIPPEG